MVSAKGSASIANLLVGFDVLGLEFPQLYDSVEVEKIESGVEILAIHGSNKLPLNPEQNTAGKALLELIRGESLNYGFSIVIHKGIPLGSGLGGSAASAVAAVLAANKLLSPSLPKDKLLIYALEGEKIASGTIHADNVAASLYGGLVLCSRLNSSFRITQLPIPKMFIIVLSPDIVINTNDARDILPNSIPLKDYVQQSMYLSSFIIACYQNNMGEIANSLKDIIVEPVRSSLIPEFSLLKKTAIEAGALIYSISGAGPTMFSICDDERTAQNVKNAISNLSLPYSLRLYDFQPKL